MDDSEAKQRATDALLGRFVEGLNLQRVENLPQPVYGFNPEGWLLFFFSYRRRDITEGEYLAVKRETGDVKFLGPLVE
jgi:hypothetical protein